MKNKTLIYPVFLPMRGCPQRCVYCDQSRISGVEDLSLAAELPKIADFIKRNAVRAKQVAFYGGSFTALDAAFREKLLSAVLAVCDAQTSFRISTHPLYVGPEILDWCASRRIRTIELGIQDFDDAVLKQSERGYTGNEALAAARRVKDAGFELGVQLMPGLPGWSEESLRTNHRTLEELKPKFLRLYPLIVIRGTPLEELFRKGDYVPLSLDEAIRHCADYFPLAERCGIRIIKLGLPSNLKREDIVAGPWHPNFGELVRAALRSNG
ncbi:MAG TPA: radical SAM protein [Candidatus Syntrophosphaera sp.]|jgi:histone acetyltransferase (RNA polymerase elongator complex component)|nr:radical SAM protein [Candidatus Syntrophosphaera sp.]